MTTAVKESGEMTKQGEKGIIPIIEGFGWTVNPSAREILRRVPAKGRARVELVEKAGSGSFHCSRFSLQRMGYKTVFLSERLIKRVALRARKVLRDPGQTLVVITEEERFIVFFHRYDGQREVVVKETGEQMLGKWICAVTA
ncbi:MAG: hypothetical protein KGH93_00535 [Patescibacteria group bacterium]|nr:hypothetical protein [Patescibacteria group bacterium]MDE1945677.1 hypothetical protein [Patescibacteria group bacterium]